MAVGEIPQVTNYTTFRNAVDNILRLNGNSVVTNSIPHYAQMACLDIKRQFRLPRLRTTIAQEVLNNRIGIPIDLLEPVAVHAGSVIYYPVNYIRAIAGERSNELNVLDYEENDRFNPFGEGNIFGKDGENYFFAPSLADGTEVSLNYYYDDPDLGSQNGFTMAISGTTFTDGVFMPGLPGIGTLRIETSDTATTIADTITDAYNDNTANRGTAELNIVDKTLIEVSSDRSVIFNTNDSGTVTSIDIAGVRYTGNTITSQGVTVTFTETLHEDNYILGVAPDVYICFTVAYAFRTQKKHDEAQQWITEGNKRLTDIRLLNAQAEDGGGPTRFRIPDIFK